MLLRKFYGYSSFYPLQFEVIKHVCNGLDAVVLMPTGGGKSLCYQLPALMCDGCAIVVSPLLSLMKDQVDALLACGIPAAAVNSEHSEAHSRDVLDNVFAGHIKLLYISPERLLTDMERWSQNLKINLIAIDEAHCISQWGHDFRPEYTRLSALRDRFPNVPIMALTATADKLTREDIAVQLRIPDAKLFINSFDRPNISLTVMAGLNSNDKLRHIVSFIDRHPHDSGIIYCMRRRDTETMANTLRSYGFNAQSYHAGMKSSDRQQVQQAFVNDTVQVVCATIAFGMGINKSNVRWVIHSNMPKSIEGYYQEIGRAGRDGAPAEALLFYNYGDISTLMNFAVESGQSAINIEKLNRMKQYAEASVCRRRILLSYFNEPFDHDCHNCDVCNNPPLRIDGTIYAQMAISAVLRTGQKIGMAMLVDILRGSRRAAIVEAGFDKIKTYGIGRSMSTATWNNYLLQMLQLGIFEVAYNEGNTLKVTNYGYNVLRGQQGIELSEFFYDNPKRSVKDGSKRNVRTIETPSAPASQSDNDLFEKLRQLRMKIAQEQHLAPFMVFSDKTLREIASQKPTTQAQFGLISGVGQVKNKRYWKAFTTIVKEFLDNTNN